MSGYSCWRAAIVCVFLGVSAGVFAATPVAAIGANPASGLAPLDVFFNSSDSTDAQTLLWDFGDGAVSTARNPEHVYNVAGTYVTTLTVFNAGNESHSTQVTITVLGTGEGPLTARMNFRMSLLSSTIKLNHKVANKDSLALFADFNTVDLPGLLPGQAAEFSVNGLFSISGVLDSKGIFQNSPTHKPSIFLQIDRVAQQLQVLISRADLKAAMGYSGATNATVPAPGKQVPITLWLTIGAQTYSITEDFNYISTQNGLGRAKFSLSKKTGKIDDGFFVINNASAIENPQGTAHTFAFTGHLARPLGVLLQGPGGGAFRIKLSEATTIVLPFDRVLSSGTRLYCRQPARAVGSIRTLTIDTLTRSFSLKTWDIPWDTYAGGSGLPIRGRPILQFDFTVRLDLDQPDGTVFRAVTATRLSRKSKDDAFWQTGRRPVKN